MPTSKPISTISYNTIPFLKEKLEKWYKAHIIQAYQFIRHIGEDGDKDHIHLRVEPNKRIDPMELINELFEYEEIVSKPLGCRPWRPSKEEDWFLYVVHDKDYLKYKYGGGEKGEKIEYSWQDIVANDNYDVQIAYIRAKQSLSHTSANLAKQIQNGMNPIELIVNGENPYLVNSVNTALFANDYNRMVTAYNYYKNLYEQICKIFLDNGYNIVYNDNKVIIEGINKNEIVN